MKWNTDWGLRARMVGVMGLLVILYIGLASALTLYFGEMLSVLLAIAALSGAQLWYGPKLALRMMGGRTVSDSEYPTLHSQVTRLSQQAGIQKPDVAVAQNKMPNAFAAGRSQKSSVVCVTTGLLETLNDEELEAVLAHELAHIQNRDMVIMTAASALSSVAYFIVRWGFIFGDGGGDGGDSSQPHMLVAVLVALVVWIASFFAIRLLSRYREYTADRGAATITGNPAALASALQSIDGGMNDVPKEDMREAGGMNALMFTDVEASKLEKWFRTHPAVEQRVERLRDLERQT